MAGNPPSRHLWVGGLPEEIGEVEIKELFTKYGKVEGVKILPQRYPNQGVAAFIDFYEVRSAVEAREAKIVYGGCELRTNFKTKTTERFGDRREDFVVKRGLSPSPPPPDREKERSSNSSSKDKEKSRGKESTSSSSSSSFSSSGSSSSDGGSSSDSDNGTAGSKKQRKKSKTTDADTVFLKISNLANRPERVLQDGLYYEFTRYCPTAVVRLYGDGRDATAVVKFDSKESCKKAFTEAQGLVLFGNKLKVSQVNRNEFPSGGRDIQVVQTGPSSKAYPSDDVDPQATHSLFVGNIPKNISVYELRDIFQRYGDVVDVEIKKMSGNTTYGFVLFYDLISAVAAKQYMDGENVHGHNIRVGFGKGTPSKMLWVDGIDPETSESALERALAKYGKVVRLGIDRQRCSAMVQYESIEVAKEALSGLKGTFIGNSRRIVTDFANRDARAAFFARVASGETVGPPRFPGMYGPGGMGPGPRGMMMPRPGVPIMGMGRGGFPPMAAPPMDMYYYNPYMAGEGMGFYGGPHFPRGPPMRGMRRLHPRDRGGGGGGGMGAGGHFDESYDDYVDELRAFSRKREIEKEERKWREKRRRHSSTDSGGSDSEGGGGGGGSRRRKKTQRDKEKSRRSKREKSRDDSKNKDVGSDGSSGEEENETRKEEARLRATQKSRDLREKLKKKSEKKEKEASNSDSAVNSDSNNESDLRKSLKKSRDREKEKEKEKERSTKDRDRERERAKEKEREKDKEKRRDVGRTRENRETEKKESSESSRNKVTNKDRERGRVRDKEKGESGSKRGSSSQSEKKTSLGDQSRSGSLDSNIKKRGTPIRRSSETKSRSESEPKTSAISPQETPVSLPTTPPPPPSSTTSAGEAADPPKTPPTPPAPPVLITGVDEDEDRVVTAVDDDELLDDEMDTLPSSPPPPSSSSPHHQTKRDKEIESAVEAIITSSTPTRSKKEKVSEPVSSVPDTPESPPAPLHPQLKEQKLESDLSSGEEFPDIVAAGSPASPVSRESDSLAREELPLQQVPSSSAAMEKKVKESVKKEEEPEPVRFKMKVSSHSRLRGAGVLSPSGQWSPDRTSPGQSHGRRNSPPPSRAPPLHPKGSSRPSSPPGDHHEERKSRKLPRCYQLEEERGRGERGGGRVEYTKEHRHSKPHPPPSTPSPPPGYGASSSSSLHRPRRQHSPPPPSSQLSEYVGERRWRQRGSRHFSPSHQFAPRRYSRSPPPGYMQSPPPSSRRGGTRSPYSGSPPPRARTPIQRPPRESRGGGGGGHIGSRHRYDSPPYDGPPRVKHSRRGSSPARHYSPSPPPVSSRTRSPGGGAPPPGRRHYQRRYSCSPSSPPPPPPSMMSRRSPLRRKDQLRSPSPGGSSRSSPRYHDDRMEPRKYMKKPSHNVYPSRSPSPPPPKAKRREGVHPPQREEYPETKRRRVEESNRGVISPAASTGGGISGPNREENTKTFRSEKSQPTSSSTYSHPSSSSSSSSVSTLPSDQRYHGHGKETQQRYTSGAVQSTQPPEGSNRGIARQSGGSGKSVASPSSSSSTGGVASAAAVSKPPPQQQQKRSAQTTAQPPDNLMDLLRRYPVMWQGHLTLKNESAAVQLHFLSGNVQLAKNSLPGLSEGQSPALRIAQRMRLEQTQLEGVQRRMQNETEHCLLLALPCGRDAGDVRSQTHALKNSLISYLLQKQAAGIINVPGSQTGFVLHIFPPCPFSQTHLSRVAPDLLSSASDNCHLMIVVATM